MKRKRKPTLVPAFPTQTLSTLYPPLAAVSKKAARAVEREFVSFLKLRRKRAMSEIGRTIVSDDE